MISAALRSKACWEVGYRIPAVLTSWDEEFTCFEIADRLGMNPNVVISKVKRMLNDGVLIRTHRAWDTDKRSNPSRYKMSEQFKQFLIRFPEYMQETTVEEYS